LSKKRYIVTLTFEEREHLQALIARGRVAAYVQRHARILLKADQGSHGEGWIDTQIAQALEVDRTTVERLRRRFVEEGLEACLGRKEQRHRKPHKIDGAAEAHLIALACSKPPEGRARWSLRLLADRLIALELVDHVCPETVRQKLKKTK
jgi:transposase